MAWVPLQESTLNLEYNDNGGYEGGVNLLDSSTVIAIEGGQCWVIDNQTTSTVQLRITAQSYQSFADDEQPGCSFIWYDQFGAFQSQGNANQNSDPGFMPGQFEVFVGPGAPCYYWQSGADAETSGPFSAEAFSWYIEVWEEDVPPEPTPGAFKFTTPSYSFELDRGWSFDGQYIPHFLELNWFFGEDPVTYKSVSKIRIHGLVKGVVNLQVQLSGMQGDVTTDYLEDYMAPEFLDFPFTPIHVQSDFVPATNYVDYSDRGIALQMKFEGRNEDVTLPEPAHVIQVLALQSSPTGNGKRAQ